VIAATRRPTGLCRDDAGAVRACHAGRPHGPGHRRRPFPAGASSADRGVPEADTGSSTSRRRRRSGPSRESRADGSPLLGAAIVAGLAAFVTLMTTPWPGRGPARLLPHTAAQLAVGIALPA
jgi:hypothetical protein